jgi:hypothetical protein
MVRKPSDSMSPDGPPALDDCIAGPLDLELRRTAGSSIPAA